MTGAQEGDGRVAFVPPKHLHDSAWGRPLQQQLTSQRLDLKFQRIFYTPASPLSVSLILCWLRKKKKKFQLASHQPLIDVPEESHLAISASVSPKKKTKKTPKTRLSALYWLYSAGFVKRTQVCDDVTALWRRTGMKAWRSLPRAGNVFAEP